MKQTAFVILVRLKSFQRKEALDNCLWGTASPPLLVGWEGPSGVCWFQFNTSIALPVAKAQLTLPLSTPKLSFAGSHVSIQARVMQHRSCSKAVLYCRCQGWAEASGGVLG